MSLRTLFTPDLENPDAGTAVELDGDEARHVRSLRLRPGEAIRVTNGRGRLWRARIEETGRGSATCVIETEGEAAGALPVELAIPVAHKDRTLWLVEKAVELGATSLQPIAFERSRSVADAARSRSFWRKAHRRAIAALKQSGRALLPEIGPVRELEDYLRSRVLSPGAGRPTGPAASGGRMAVRLEGGAVRTLRDELGRWTGTGLLRILIGPEGGFVEAERSASDEAGFAAATLGVRTLRFETAAIAAVTIAGQQAEVAGERHEVGASEVRRVKTGKRGKRANGPEGTDA